MAEEENFSTSFQRQRRDLFVIAALLVVAQLAELRAEKLAFLGMELRVDKASYLIGTFWALWVYWYWRFYQAFRAVQGKSIIYESYKSAFRSALEAHTQRKAQELETVLLNDRRGENLSHSDLQFSLRHDVHWDSATAFYITRWQNKKSEIVSTPDIEVKVGALKVWGLRVRVIVLLAIQDFAISEYALPFFFGAAPPVAYWLKCIGMT